MNFVSYIVDRGHVCVGILGVRQRISSCFIVDRVGTILSAIGKRVNG